jgi:hypothetical protein
VGVNGNHIAEGADLKKEEEKKKKQSYTQM